LGYVLKGIHHGVAGKLNLVIILTISFFCLGLLLPPVAAGAPGWKFHADLNNSGIYDDGGVRPSNDLKWSVQTGTETSSPAVVNGVVYIGSDDQKVYALDAGTGAMLWNYTTGGYVDSSPAVVSNVVYIGSNDGNVSALNANNGTRRWNYQTGSYVVSSPAVANGSVYVGSYDGKVYALDAGTGAKLWNYTTAGVYLESSPAVADGVVYIGSGDGKVYALNANNGTERWDFSATDSIDMSSPAVAGGVVYIGSLDHKIYALDAGTGVMLWNFTTGDMVESSPAVSGGVVYVGSYDGKVYALDAGTGAMLWNYTTGAGVLSNPAVANGVVYAGSRDQKVYALDAGTGAMLWNYTTGNLVFSSSPAVAAGTVYIANIDGNVFALYKIPQTPVAGFSANITAGAAPLAVNFTDSSTATPIAWNWSFGDGSFSGLQNPVHVYTYNGTFTVILNASNANGYNVSKKTGYIRVDYANLAMFHGDLLHTGVYDDGGSRPTNNATWSFGTGKVVYSSPAVSNGVVYFGSNDNRTYALNASTGTELWDFPTGAAVNSSPAVAGGAVFIGSNDNRVYAINAKTGAVLWNFLTGGQVNSSPAVTYDVVYVGSSDAKVYAINARNGTKLWDFATGGGIDSSPAVANGVVYVGSADTKVYALNASTGAMIWNYTTFGPVHSSPALSGIVVYVGSDDGKIYALGTNFGNQFWNYQTAGQVRSSPAVTDNTVYIGSGDHKLYAFASNTGAKLWDFTTGGPVDSSPAVANGIVYAGSSDKKVYALNASTGTELWDATTSSPVHSSPVVTNGTVCIGSDDGTIYAFGGPLPVDFTANVTEGAAPLAVQFTDKSDVLAPTRWNWTFGDGGNFSTGTAGLKDATHTYTTSGTFTVNLTVTNATRSYTKTQWGYIAVIPGGSYGPSGWKFHSDLNNSGVYDDGGVHPKKTLKWRFTSGNSVESSPAVAGGVVYVGSDDNKVYAVNASTGENVWNYTTGGEVHSSPAVADGVVYVGSEDNKVYALDAGTGSKFWDFTTGGEVHSSPAVADGVVYFGSDDGRVYALDAVRGTALWNFTTGDSVESSPAVVSGVVYVGSANNKVYALDAATGAEHWNYTTGGAIIHSSPAVANGTVYIGSYDNRVYALDAATGTRLWRYSTDDTVESTPAVAGDTVYVGSDDDYVYALNATSGEARWYYPTGGYVTSSPAVANGNVYIGSQDSKVYALNAGTGAKLWDYLTGAGITSSPAVAGGTVYIGGGDKALYAIGGIPPAEVANFSANITTGPPPLDVQFTDKSDVIAPTRWDWRFGDGGIFSTGLAALKNASHTYATPGFYTVNLTVTNATGSYSASKPRYIFVSSGGVPATGGWKFRADLNNTGVYDDGGTRPSNAMRWNFTTEDSVLSSPAIAYGSVYVGSDDKSLYALDESTGEELWSFATGDVVESSPVVSGGVVYFGSGDDNVYALDAATGSELWNFTTGNGVYSSPAVVNGVVYTGSYDHNVYALDAGNGSELWNFTTGDGVYSSPAVVNGVVYTGSDDYNVYALDASTGAKLWNFTTGNYVESSPAVVNGVVYIGSDDNNTYALDAGTGAKLWNFTTGSSVFASPAIADGVVYVGSYDNKVYALDAGTGTMLWNYTTGSWLESGPSVANGVVYVGSDDKKVYALNASTGARLWSYATGNYVDSSPSVADGTVFVGSYDGKVYALGNTPPPAPVAGFTANTTAGTFPLTVAFTDTSTGSPTTWTWSFGDMATDNTSTLQNPVHVYQEPGAYTVALIVSNAQGGSDIVTRPDSVLVKQWIQWIPAGGAVYIGEDNLGIAPGLGGSDSLAWFPATALPASGTPERVLDVSSTKNSFFVDPSIFGARTGNWYCWTAGQTLGNSAVAIQVLDPAIDLRILDVTTGTDVTGKAIPVGDEIGFGINNNYSAVTGRGTAVAPVTITVQGPDGTVYSSLTNGIGTVSPLTDIPVPTNTFMTGSYWNTENPLYRPGNYTVTAVCNLNHMLDNYRYNGGGYAGKTISPNRTVKLSSSSVVTLPPPKILAVSPVTGYRNVTVAFSVTGSNFQPGGTIAEFRNQSTGRILNVTTLSSVTATRLNGLIMIPSNATQGMYNLRIITTDGGESTQPNALSVSNLPPPTIATVAPATPWYRNASIKFLITGTNFQPGQTTVAFTYPTNGTVLNATDGFTVDTITATTINGTIIIPYNAPVGTWNVSVTTLDGGRVWKPTAFTVANSLKPTIATVAPATPWYRNASIKFLITGTNFQPGQTTVAFTYPTNGTPLNVTGFTVNTITPITINGTIVVPYNASVGTWNVSVTTLDGGKVWKPAAFTVANSLKPTIATVAPATPWYRNASIKFLITGTNFQPGQTTVAFTYPTNGTALNVTDGFTVDTITATTINGTIVVPYNASVGTWNVSVTTLDGGKVWKAAAFTVANSLKPTIATVAPATPWYRNASIKFLITGTNFQPGQTTVAFTYPTNGTALNVTDGFIIDTITATTINGTVVVPYSAPTGTWNVSVTTLDGGKVWKAAAFTVSSFPAPVITSINPNTGNPNSTIYYTIAGNNFEPGLTAVKMGHMAYGEIVPMIYSVTLTQITGGIYLPADAPPGPWYLNISTADGGSTNKSPAFTLNSLPPPVITTLLPVKGYRGTEVSFIIEGNSLQSGGRTVVNFTRTAGTSNMTTTLTSVYPTRITGNVVIPDTPASLGLWNITVITVNGGWTTKTNVFTVLG
jgi:outer membrane protein assembly factor BamB